MKHVIFEQAKWLKEKGFNEDCRAFYLDGNLETSKHSIGNYNDVKWVRTWRNSPNDDIISAPEQHQVVEWLRVNHGIWISVDMVYETTQTGFWYSIRQSKEDDKAICSNEYPTPQEAYSAAFDYIKNNNLV